VQAIHRCLPDEPDGMAGLEAARRINGLPCTLKQRIWQLEHAEEWGEVVYAYEQVFCFVAAAITSSCTLLLVPLLSTQLLLLLLLLCCAEVMRIKYSVAQWCYTCMITALPIASDVTQSVVAVVYIEKLLAVSTQLRLKPQSAQR
jgi:hypothetical protein